MVVEGFKFDVLLRRTSSVETPAVVGERLCDVAQSPSPTLVVGADDV